MKHAEAKKLVDETLPDLTAAESLILRAVALHETQYGQGWKGSAGEGSNNMGAITKKPGPDGDCGSDGFPHGDSRFDAKLGKVVKYTGCFRRYPDAAAGFRDLADTLLKKNVRRAAPGGPAPVAVAMRKNRYYLGTASTRDEQIDEYSQALARAVASIRGATDEPDPFVSAATGGRPSQRLGSPASFGSSGHSQPLGPGQPSPAALLAELRKVGDSFSRSAEALESGTEALDRASDVAADLVDALCRTVPPPKPPKDDHGHG